MLQAELDSDDDEHSSGGGRRHVSASVSKTLFSVNTPASQKRAIQRLKQSLTFSDNSVSGHYPQHKYYPLCDSGDMMGVSVLCVLWALMCV